MRKPDFIIVGCQKSATTALARYLVQHEDIWMPKDEVHYFDQKTNMGDEWYCSLFDRKEKVVGEKSPAYCYFYDIPKRIATLNPKCKIIMCVREPIARAYSEYQMLRLNGVDSREWKHAYRYKHYLPRGHYADQLKNIYKYFPKEQVLVIKSEDLYENRLETVRRVARFLDVDDSFTPDMPLIHQGGQVKSKALQEITGLLVKIRWLCVNKPYLLHIENVITYCIGAIKIINKKEKYPPMSKEMWDTLFEYYKDMNEDFYKMTGIRWNYE